MSDSVPLDEVSELPRKENGNRRSIPMHWIVLGLLVLAHALFGAVFNPLGKNVGEGANVGPYMMMGFLFSQPILFAIWAAFAPQRFYLRFLWSLLFCTLVSFTVELGPLLHARNGLGQSMMLDIPLFIVATIILLLVRRFSHWQIEHFCEVTFSTDYQANQFGITHLIILTTILALACGLFRTLLIINPDLKWLPSVAQFFGFAGMTLALLFPVIVIPWYTLAYRGNIMFVTIFMIIIWGAINLLVFLILKESIPVGRGGFINEIVKPILFIQLGAGLSGFVTTLVIRLCGFRMVRERNPLAS